MGGFRNKEDLTGRKYNRLTVIGLDGPNSGKVRWFCKCECGNTISILGSTLLSLTTMSCGCYQKEVLRQRATSHGHTANRSLVSSEYGTWCSMKARCYCKTNPKYYMYGARGITVCDSWRTSFESFFSDMGSKPARGYSIDRINGNGNYEPGNCRWATASEQQRNIRNNRWIMIRGERYLISDLAKKWNVNDATIRYHIGLGRDIEEIEYRLLNFKYKPQKSIDIMSRKTNVR